MFQTVTLTLQKTQVIYEKDCKLDSLFISIKSGLFNAELEMMRERFAKLLLGEDMSGSGKGVCTAVTVSNSITNLYGSFSPPFFLSY